MSFAKTDATATLPPVAAKVDAALARLDGTINWLHELSPIHNDAMWHAFESSGFKQLGDFKYAPTATNWVAVRDELLALPLTDIEIPAIEALLAEKQHELDRQLELIRLRGTGGFTAVSIDLFGTATPTLINQANEILSTLPVQPALRDDADINDFVDAANDDYRWYSQQAPGFNAKIIIEDDLNSLMMVSGGNLYMAANIRQPKARVQALMQHEIGAHVVTRHNGSLQPLQQLAYGLAHYDVLQEGMGVLSEYLAGYLPASRLRIIAARVIATDMAINGEQVPAIYAVLHEEHKLEPDDAFDTAVRACRGGGLTKDVAYLAGLIELLAFLQAGGDFSSLFFGKFALSQLPVLNELEAEGLLRPAELMPRYLHNPQARERLENCRTLTVAELYQKDPV